MKLVEKITDDEFDKKLSDVINKECTFPSDLLGIPGVYEILSEYYNNDVIEEITKERRSKRG